MTVKIDKLFKSVDKANEYISTYLSTHGNETVDFVMTFTSKGKGDYVRIKFQGIHSPVKEGVGSEKTILEDIR